MLSEKALVRLGEMYQPEGNNSVIRVEEVEDGVKDAIIRIGEDKILAVSEDSSGQMRSVFGKSACFIKHGEWEIISSQGSKHKFNLLED